MIPTSTDIIPKENKYTGNDLRKSVEVNRLAPIANDERTNSIIATCIRTTAFLSSLHCLSNLISWLLTLEKRMFSAYERSLLSANLIEYLLRSSFNNRMRLMVSEKRFEIDSINNAVADMPNAGARIACIAVIPEIIPSPIYNPFLFMYRKSKLNIILYSINGKILKLHRPAYCRQEWYVVVNE